MFLILLNLLSGCYYPFLFGNNEQQLSDEQWQIILTYRWYSGMYIDTSLTDNMDGTVTLTNNYTNRISKNYIINKCLQGQVYRSVENDCRGAGSSSDNYGVQAYQFCSQNDGSCVNSDGDLAGTGISEAYNTCDQITPSGDWKVMELSLKDSVINFYDVYPDFPVDSGDSGFWLNDGGDQEARFNYISMSNRSWKPITEKHYVLCMKK